MLSQPRPFAEAVASIQGRRLLPTALGHADLEQLGQAMRRRALVLARVVQAEVLDKVDRDIRRMVAGVSSGPGDYTNPATIRTGLKQLLAEIEYRPDADRVGTISDLRTDQRLNLIIETEAKLARGRGQFAQANDPDSLAIFPCAELVRVEQRDTPRGFVRRKGQLVQVESDHWRRRWREAGGETYEGRMIARLDDPVWTGISRFGLPHPPFDFNSGMGTQLVRRSEAIRLGVIEPGDVVPSQPGESPDEIASVPVPTVGEPFLQALQQSGYTIARGLLTVA